MAAQPTAEASFPSVRKAGPLLFTSSFDGDSDASGDSVDADRDVTARAREQCERSYGSLCRDLGKVGLGPGAVVRLEHYTSSQDWLPERSAIRARIFGHPALLASTGVSARMRRNNMLSTAAVAVCNGNDKSVLVPGADYGIPHLSSLVQAGPLWFLSGLRGHHHPLSGQEMPTVGRNALRSQASAIYESIRTLIEHAGGSLDAVVRIEVYLRHASHIRNERAVRSSVLGPTDAPVTLLALPLGGLGDVEIGMTLAAPRRGIGSGVVVEPRRHTCAGGFHFITSTEHDSDIALGNPREDLAAQTHEALTALDARLSSVGLMPQDIARLEVVVRDIENAHCVHRHIADYCGAALPTVVTIGADLPPPSLVRLQAIAYRNDAVPTL